ncbi:MAG: TolC family protein [Thermoanaerobaculia bacterium]
MASRIQGDGNRNEARGGGVRTAGGGALRAAVALLLVAAPGFAAETPVPATGLTLADALARGRVGAGESVAAEARQRAAEARSDSARGSRWPALRISEQWIRTDSPADAFALQLNQERFSFADFVSGDPNAPETLETAISRVELELPIWTGGEISARVEQARLTADAAGVEAAWTADRAAVDAADAWVHLAEARESVALLEASRETVAAHVELARNFVAEGLLVRSDLLRAEVEQARVDDLLLEARGRERVAEANLAYRLGEPLDSRYLLAALDEPPPLPGGASTAAASERGDVAAARLHLAAGELEVKAQRGGLLPRIGVVARHDWVDDRLFGGHGDSTTIAALASIELFDGGRRRNAVAAAKAEAEAGRADLQRLADGAALELRQAHEAAAVARERRTTAAAALAAAAEGVRILEERFRAGVVRSTDLLDAATARREAQLRELVARSDAWLAALHLALARGEAPESILRTSEPTTEGGDVP